MCVPVRRPTIGVLWYPRCPGERTRRCYTHDVARDRTLELRPAAAEVTAGTALQLNLVLVSGPTRTELIPGHRATWTSSAPSVAEVNRQGRVSARAPGTAVITAAHEGRSATASIVVP